MSETAGHSMQRVSHDDREMAAERLRSAAGDGRISLDELDLRLGAVFTATTYADLESVTADLPPAAAELVAAQASRRSIRFAVSDGSIDRFGTWEIPSRIDLFLEHATSTLDFRTDSLGRQHATVRDRFTRSGSARELSAIRVTGDIRRGSVRVLRRPFQLF